MGKPTFNRLKDEKGERMRDTPITFDRKYISSDGATHFGYGAGKIGLFKSSYPGDYKGKKRTFVKIRAGQTLSLPEFKDNTDNPKGYFYGKPLWQK